jgi:hypothetical protein
MFEQFSSMETNVSYICSGALKKLHGLLTPAYQKSRGEVIVALLPAVPLKKNYSEEIVVPLIPPHHIEKGVLLCSPTPTPPTLQKLQRRNS